MRIRKLLNQVLRPTGYTISKSRELPRFTECRVFESMVRASRPKTIFDVGGNVGQTAIAFAREFPETPVYTFEPFQAAFDKLRANVHAIPNIHPFKLAAGAGCGRREVFLNSEAASQVNSLADTQQATLRNHAAAVENIELITLDRFCQDQSIATIDILKTDTEGYDIEVLIGAKGLLSAQRISAVICEVGMAGDSWHTNFFEVAELLGNYGMKAVGFYETDYQLDGHFSYTNALFANRTVPNKPAKEVSP